MAELTNRVEADLVLDKKLDAARYEGGDLKNYVASQEITVTITLSEYRSLVAEKATKDADIHKARSDQYERNQKIQALENENAELKAENYELKKRTEELDATIIILQKQKGVANGRD